MSTNKELQALRERLLSQVPLLQQVQADLSVYLEGLQDRHDQLGIRVSRLERQVDAITNPETPKNRRLLSNWETLSDAHSESEDVLDDLENLVLEPLREVQETLHRRVS